MSRPARRSLRQSCLAAGLAIGLLGPGLLAPRVAQAWDPSTTHLGMLERAVLGSALHLRWMASSELQRGLFSPLRVDPRRLGPAERRFLSAALNQAHSGSGVLPLGGPGACPGPTAPVATQLYCVEGDLWEMPAVQWMELGVVAEMVPSARAVHHFVDRADPSRESYSDPQQRPLLLRSRQFRHNGAPLAGYITGTSYAGAGRSAIAWLADASDPLAPPQTFRHLELASTLADPHARDHHLAMALIGVGALLHVLQDMSVPAHARGDVSAFFTALSDAPADRGLPFAEIARLSFGRHDLPGKQAAAVVTAARGAAAAAGLRAHFLGDADYEGLAVFTGRRFFSERSLPAPQFLEPETAADEAAAQLLVGADLDPGELQGAVLSPWPAERGYLKTATGRPLAAFDTDELGRVRTFIDEAVYREQFAQLIPRGVEASRSLIDWLWPTWPELRLDAAAGHVDLQVPEDWQEPVLLVFTQTAEGQRAIKQKVQLRAGAGNRVLNLPKLAGDQRTVIVLRARRSSGEPLILEHVLGAESKTFGVVPAPAPPALPATEAAPPQPAEEAPADPDTSEAEDGLLPTTTSPVDPGAPVSKDSKPAAPGKPDPKGKPAAPGKPDPKDSKPGAPGKPDPKDSKPGAPGKPDPEGKPGAPGKPVSEDSKPVPEDSKPAAPLPGGRSRFGTPELK
jgi:hypothetical protein